MAAEYLRRLQHKNFFPVLLIINAKPFFFPKAWVSESYSLGSVVQYAAQKDDPFIVVPSERSIHLSLQIPMEQTFHKTYYNIVKQTIRATTLLCTTTKTYTKHDEVRGSEKISLFDGMSFKFPIKKNAAPLASATLPINAHSYDERLAAAKSKVKSHIVLEKSGLAGGGSKKKFQFSKMALPHWIPVACGYFGYSVQSFGCILTSFSTSAAANEGLENWQIALVEYEWKNTEDINETPQELGDGAKGGKKIEIAPERKIVSSSQESSAQVDMKSVQAQHKEVQNTLKDFGINQADNVDLVTKTGTDYSNFSNKDWLQFVAEKGM